MRIGASRPLLLVLLVLAPVGAAQPIPEPQIAQSTPLVTMGSEWQAWVNETIAPPVWPLTEPIADARLQADVLPIDAPVTTDVRIDLAAPTSSDWSWTTMFAPFTAMSSATWVSLADTWARAEERRIRYERPPPVQTTFLYDTGETGPTTGGSTGPDEPGLSNLYVAHTFQVDDPSAIATMQVNVEFSGGIIMYLNGREILRHHIAPGSAVHGHNATPYWLPDHVNQRSRFRWQMTWMGIDPSLLREGENVLSAALYKLPSGGRSAIYFDAELLAFDAAGLTRTPYLQSMTQNSMTVAWESNVPAYGYVEYGPEGSPTLTRVAADALIASERHEVVLQGLEPDTRYFYRTITVPVPMSPGQPALPTLTEDIRYFRTSVPRGTPFSFIAYGDTRTQADIHTALNQQLWEDAVRNDARFVIHTGDITTYGASWDEWQEEFFEPALPLMGHLPFYTSLGNHEGNHEKYYTYMALPGNEAWYEFSVGDVDFFALNSSFDYSPGSAQYTWFEEALAVSDATWQIAFFHHPPYACTPSRKPGDMEVQTYLVPLFEQYGVSFVVLGHDHLYGRSAELNGVRYVITGGGGAPSYPAEPDPINEVCVEQFHYCVLDVSEDRIVLEAIALGGLVLDTLVIDHSNPPRE